MNPAITGFFRPLTRRPLLPLLFGLLAFCTSAFSQAEPTAGEATTAEVPADTSGGEAVATLDTGNTAWMITATALVLFMTLPGLALFYGGLVQSKNVLSVLMHCFTIACLMSIIWVVCGYSLALTDGPCPYIGGTGEFFLKGLTEGGLEANGFPTSVWIIFQMTFAVITPGLIVGAFVERMKFVPMMAFCALWLLLVYVPVCYWVWGNGWLKEKGVIDFAGGIVVHATAGAAALVLAKLLGPRKGFPTRLTPPHSPGMVMTGASMLWVGWFGFNAGSAGAANGDAGMAMLVTHISAAAASLTWMFIEWGKSGKPGLVGIVTGMVAGLATITPASGIVGPQGALVIGILAGFVCYFMCGIIKENLKIDDSLDVFAVHGVGGIMGTLLVSFLGNSLGGQGISKHESGESFTVSEQFTVQLTGVLAAVALSVVATVVIVKILEAVCGGIRVPEEEEINGLDQSHHGEKGYHI
jgi:Amt family ammonium transporter